MAVAKPAAAHQLGRGTHPVSRLISVPGTVDSATPRDVEQRLAAGGFSGLTWSAWTASGWSSSPGACAWTLRVPRGREGTGQSSGLAVATTGAPQRPSVAAVGDSVRALVPGAGGPGPAAAAIPVRIVYTGKFLLTVHSVPCRALEQARHRFDGLRDEGKADGPLVVFLVLDDLAGSFEPQLLALDARLDEIQVELPVRHQDEGCRSGLP